jgi:hypothetical protein
MTVPFCEISFHCKKTGRFVYAHVKLCVSYIWGGGGVCAGQSPSDVLAVRTGVVGGGGHLLR